jgi:adhesin/invasin
LGAVTPTVAEGTPAPLSAIRTANPTTVTIGGLSAPVSFAGLAPGYVGLYQINVTVPQVSGDALPVVVTVAGRSSGNGVTMSVR